MRPGEMPVCTAPPMLRPWKGRWGASTHSAPTLKGPFTQPPSTGTPLPLSSTSTLLSSHASGYLTRAFCVQNTVRAPAPANTASGVRIFLSRVGPISLPPARYPRRSVLRAQYAPVPACLPASPQTVYGGPEQELAHKGGVQKVLECLAWGRIWRPLCRRWPGAERWPLEVARGGGV